MLLPREIGPGCLSLWERPSHFAAVLHLYLSPTIHARRQPCKRSFVPMIYGRSDCGPLILITDLTGTVLYSETNRVHRSRSRAASPPAQQQPIRT
ncbi:hypothetical protein N7510_009934 [Penicillium lagena]|uniref:uncharacterized protein n=1 Tax=Penicillium lagena TaxID=94218 RepID=UPI002541240D|nr:uncharacterized protein N7510_009934 [Penicillium lagena]KAJ5604780.1 hypothetical protein N7510_009934 [Penicillium lagena]